MQMFTLTHNSIAVTEKVTFRIVWLLTVSTPSPGFRTKLESVPSGMFAQSCANISDPISSPDEMSAVVNALLDVTYYVVHCLNRIRGHKMWATNQFQA
jgi:hypothetical protein